MPSAVHHITVVSHEPDRVVTILREALGLPEVGGQTMPLADVAALFGWQSGPGLVHSTMLGGTSVGLVEIVSLSGTKGGAISNDGGLQAGPYQLCFGVRDLDRTLEACRGLGVDEVRGPERMDVAGHPTVLATVRVGGVRMQLSQSIDPSTPPS